jgi:hypothetical protein
MPAGAGPIAGPGRIPGRFEPGGEAPRGAIPQSNSGPARPDEIIVILKADLFTQQVADPREQLAISQTSFEVLQEAQKLLRSDTGVSHSSGTISQGVVSIRVRFDGDPQAFAGKITFGTVDAVDAAARRVEVSVPPELVEQVRQARAQDR